MEDLSNLCALQSLAFITDHLGFCGVIKNSPQDFVVTEIDMTGQSVRAIKSDPSQESGEVAANGISPLQQHPKDQVLHKQICLEVTSLACCGFEDGSGMPENDPLVNTDIIDGEEGCSHSTVQALSSLLDASVQEELTKFAGAVKDAWHPDARATMVPTELSLGAFLDKKQRADLHAAVRQTYPFLVTATKSNEVIVKPNFDYQELCRLVSQEESDSFFKFLDAKLENSKYTFKPDVSKEHRTQVHHFLSKKFGKLVETKSFSDCNSSGQQNVAITVRFRERMGSSRKRRAVDGPDKQDIYTAFTLRKENLETLEAITYLSAELGILPSDFSYAGNKDKKAVTYQAMVVKKVAPARLMELGRKMEAKGIQVSSCCPAYQHLRLGHLKGNRFDIIVRHIQKHSGDTAAEIQERVIEAIQNVKTTGFANYYGPQRFGQRQNVQSDQIGMALLNEQMVKAVRLLFTPDQVDDPVNKAKRHFLETEDAKSTLAMMPEYKVRERMVLRALNRYGVNHEGCTRGWFSIPHSMRIFYVHAYCSRVWNEAVSYRLNTYGSKAVEGDLVLDDGNVDGKTSPSGKVHTVTAEEEASNMYTIHQVVLPMLGYSVVYPSNKVGQWYREKLTSDGLQTCNFRVQSLQLNVPGCYRLIVKQIHNLSYKILEDTDISEESDRDVKISNDRVSKASLSLSFDLDSSCYATVCLREIMKCDV
ncbi:pseudouridylate synthase PUS7L [Ambystoma mexicanum]|uniref:pseudouridylate synthase PUS7L n=1 Tax=Ambystoma mexicanum TaxID=8296 RepID=UPI0037E7E37F